jgi:imidazolonepropionase-like amidohydrolase
MTSIRLRAQKTGSIMNERLLIRPDRVFDAAGRRMVSGAAVMIDGGRIVVVAEDGEIAAADDTCRTITMPGTTLLPGLIDAHVHMFLHPYDETSWDDQIVKEPITLRAARAVAASATTLRAGFTTVRDLGTEGAADADTGLKEAIARGIVPGPRILSANRAIVATGAYGPKGYNCCTAHGAEEASGAAMITAARRQIGEGADVVKLYGDYRWRPGEPSRATFTVEEMRPVVELAHAAGRKVAVHANTIEGMRRAVLAGVDTIEHGSDGTPEIFAMMRDEGVALVPTLAATEAITRYRGWDGSEPEPEAIVAKRRSFEAALASGVTIGAGGDTGVFAHGDNAREAELMAAWGMAASDVLASLTAVNAELLGLAESIGRIEPGMIADLVAVRGDPAGDISALRDVAMVLRDGAIVHDRVA